MLRRSDPANWRKSHDMYRDLDLGMANIIDIYKSAIISEKCVVVLTFGQFATSLYRVLTSVSCRCRTYSKPDESPLLKSCSVLCAKSRICFFSVKSLKLVTDNNLILEIYHTLKRLALVPIINEAWSKPCTQLVEFTTDPFTTCVPMNVVFIMACSPGSHEPNSWGVIYVTYQNQR